MQTHIAIGLEDWSFGTKERLYTFRVRE
jgi:hypothetical protein